MNFYSIGTFAQFNQFEIRNFTKFLMFFHRFIKTEFCNTLNRENAPVAS